jgi:hypothetical protein
VGRRAVLKATFATLRDVLKKHARQMMVQADTPTDYMLASPQMTDRIGRPLFAAGVQIRKNYVSYHLMPVYANPLLLKAISPVLKKRMQGKSCFNFTTIDQAQLDELAALTKTGLERYTDLELPWPAPPRK